MKKQDARTSSLKPLDKAELPGVAGGNGSTTVYDLIDAEGTLFASGSNTVYDVASGSNTVFHAVESF